MVYNFVTSCFMFVCDHGLSSCLLLLMVAIFDLGFEILAFPCNQFGNQEPGTNEEIVQFACTRFKAEYPIFDKVTTFLDTRDEDM